MIAATAGSGTAMVTLRDIVESALIRQEPTALRQQPGLQMFTMHDHIFAFLTAEKSAVSTSVTP